MFYDETSALQSNNFIAAQPIDIKSPASGFILPITSASVNVKADDIFGFREWGCNSASFWEVTIDGKCGEN